MPATRRNRWYGAASVAFTVAGVAGIAVTLHDALGRTDAGVVPGPWALLAGYGFQALALGAAARAFVALFEGRGRPETLRRAVYVSMLGRYIPGGVWQPTSQVTIARRSGVPLGLTSLAFLLFIGGHLAAAGIFGVVLAASPSGLTPPWRILALSGILVPLGLYRPVLVRALGLIPLRRLRDGTRAIVPGQRALAADLGWNLLSLAGQAFPYVLMLDAVTDVPLVTAFAAFSVAWAAGLAAAPVPAGIGVREAVLVAILGGPAGTAAVLSVSVLHRILRIGAEVTMVILHSVAARRVTNGGSTPTAEPPRPAG